MSEETNQYTIRRDGKKDLSFTGELIAGVVDRELLLGNSKVRQVATARWRLAYRLERETGMARSQIARTLSVSPSAVAKMIKKTENRRDNRK